MGPIRLRKFRNRPVTAARFIRSVKHHFVENISVPHRIKPRQVLAILNDILEPLPGIFEEVSEVEYSHTERFVHKALRMLAGLRVVKLYPWILSSVYIFAYFLISRREKDKICMEAYDCIRKGETLNTTIVRHIVNSVIFSCDNESATDDDENHEVLSKNDIENFRRSLQRNCCKKELQVLAEWPKGLGLMYSSNEYENMENEMRHFFKLFEVNNIISSDSIEDNCTSKSSEHIDKNLENCSSENEVDIEEIFSTNPQHESNNNLNLIRLNTSCTERKHTEESKRNNNNLRTKRYKNETLKKLDALKNKKKNTRKKLRKKINKKVLPLKDIKSIADKSNNLENRCTEESSINESNLRLESNTNNELHKVERLERRKKKKKMIIKDSIAVRTRSKNKISLKELDTVDQELKDKSGEIIENNNVANDDAFTCKRVIPFAGKTVRKPLYGGPERPIEVDCSVSDTICSSEYLNKKLPGLSSEVNVIVETPNNKVKDSTSSQVAERQTDVLSNNMCTKLSSSKNVNEQLSSSSCVNDKDNFKKASAKLLNNKMYTNKRKFNAHLEKDHTNTVETNDVVTSESGVAALTTSKEKQDNHIVVNQNSANIAANQNTLQVDHLIEQPEDESNVKRIHLNSRLNNPSMISTIPLANTSSNFTAQVNYSASSSRKVYLTIKNSDLKSIEVRENNTSSASIPRIEMANDTTSAHSFTPEPLKISNHEKSQLKENTGDKFSTKRTSSVCQSEESSTNELQKRLNSPTKQKQAMLNEQVLLTGSTSKRTSIAEEDVEIEPSLSNSKKMKQQPLLQPNVKIISPNSSSDSPVMEIPVSVATLNTNLTAEDNDIEIEIVEIRKSNSFSKSIPKIKTSNYTASAHTFASDPLKILNANLSKNSNDKTAARMNKVRMLSTQVSLTEINKVNPDQVNPPQIHQNHLQYQSQPSSATSCNNVKNNTDSSNVNNSTLNFRSNILQHTESNYLDRRGPPPSYPGLSIASNRPSSSQVPNCFVRPGPPPPYPAMSIASNKTSSSRVPNCFVRPGPPPPHPALSIASNKPSSSRVPNCFVRPGPPPPYPALSIASNKPSSFQVPRDLTDSNLPSKPAVKVYSNKSKTKPRILRNVRISPQQQLNFQFDAKRYCSHLSVVRHSSLPNITSTSSNCLQSQEQQQSVSQGKPQQNHHLHQQIQWQQQQQLYGTNEVVTLVPNDLQTVVHPKKCYVCDYCPDHLIFESEGLLRKHMDVTHNYSCELCHNRYPSLQDLLQHIGVHLGVLMQNS